MICRIELLLSARNFVLHLRHACPTRAKGCCSSRREGGVATVGQIKPLLVLYFGTKGEKKNFKHR